MVNYLKQINEAFDKRHKSILKESANGDVKSYKSLGQKLEPAILNQFKTWEDDDGNIVKLQARNGKFYTLDELESMPIDKLYSITKFPKNESFKRKFNRRVKEAFVKSKGRAPLKESFSDVFADLVERANLEIEEGNDLESAVAQAIDDGLIYNSDIMDVASHYGVIDNSELFDRFYEMLFNDMYQELQDSRGDFNESLNRSIRKALKKRANDTKNKHRRG